MPEINTPACSIQCWQSWQVLCKLRYKVSVETVGFCVTVYRADQRAEIFSYGVVVWELITQEHPERGVLRDFQVHTQ